MRIQAIFNILQNYAGLWGKKDLWVHIWPLFTLMTSQISWAQQERCAVCTMGDMVANHLMFADDFCVWP